LKSSFGVKGREFAFPDLSRRKKVFNSDCPMFNGCRRLYFWDLKSSFGVKDREFLFPDLSRQKKILDFDSPMFKGKRRPSFRDLKSSFGVKYREFLFPDLSWQKKVFKDEMEIIEVRVRIFWASCNKRGGQKRLTYRGGRKAGRPRSCFSEASQ
jgi:hypothetical protein